jgi:hypothetical protein
VCHQSGTAVLGVSDDLGVWFKKLGDVARANDNIRGLWAAKGGQVELKGGALPNYLQPLGFVYTLDFRDAAKCLLESIGPDIM